MRRKGLVERRAPRSGRLLFGPTTPKRQCQTSQPPKLEKHKERLSYHIPRKINSGELVEIVGELMYNGFLGYRDAELMQKYARCDMCDRHRASETGKSILRKRSNDHRKTNNNEAHRHVVEQVQQHYNNKTRKYANTSSKTDPNSSEGPDEPRLTLDSTHPPSLRL